MYVRRIRRFPRKRPKNEGFYFLTICTKKRAEILSEIKYQEVKLSDLGHIVNKCILEIPQSLPIVKIINYVVMPDHIHLIVNIQKTITTKDYEVITVGEIVRRIKARATYEINKKMEISESIWQKKYHFKIIETKAQLDMMNQYIGNNPRNYKG